MISSTSGPLADTVANDSETRRRQVASSQGSDPAPTSSIPSGRSGLQSKLPSAGSNSLPAKSPLAPSTNSERGPVVM